jgi:hypothetical protein
LPSAVQNVSLMARALLSGDHLASTASDCNGTPVDEAELRRWFSDVHVQLARARRTQCGRGRLIGMIEFGFAHLARIRGEVSLSPHVGR